MRNFVLHSMVGGWLPETSLQSGVFKKGIGLEWTIDRTSVIYVITSHINTNYNRNKEM